MKRITLLLIPLMVILSACTPARMTPSSKMTPTSTLPQPALSTQAPGSTTAPETTPVPVITDASLLPSGPGEKAYVLAAKAGDTVTMDVTSDGVPLSLTITSPSGVQRFPEVSQVGGEYRIHHQFAAGESGDYRLMLSKADHTPSTNFTVRVTIE